MKTCHFRDTYQSSRANLTLEFMHLQHAPKLSLSEFESWSITVYLKATFILGQLSMGHQTQEISLPLRFSNEKPFASLQGQGTMHIRTLCSGSIAFSSLVTSSNLINQFLFASSRMENFLNHFLASSRTSLSMSKNLEMTITISESQQILHCFISQVLRLLAAGTKITSYWNQRQISQHLKRTLFRQSYDHMTKNVPSQTAMPANPHPFSQFPITIEKVTPPFYSFIHPKPPMHTHKCAHNLGWAGMVRDHEFVSMYLLISISMPELLLLCDCQRYCAAVYCETGSVMTAGLMLGG